MVYIYIYIYHHHHVVPLAWISLTLSRHFSLLFIASGRSSGLHPASSLSCCMYVRVGRPAFAWPFAGVHRSTSLMSSSLLLQQCPACLVRLTCIVFVTGGSWPYSWCFVGCSCQDLFNIARRTHNSMEFKMVVKLAKLLRKNRGNISIIRYFKIYIYETTHNLDFNVIGLNISTAPEGYWIVLNFI